MAIPPVVLVGQAGPVQAASAFFRSFGVEPERILGETEAEARTLGAQAFPAVDPAELRGRTVVLASEDVEAQAVFLERLLGAGCDHRHLVLHPGLFSEELAGLIRELTPDGLAGPNPFLEHLLGHYPESGVDPIRCLADLVSARIRADLDPDLPTLGVYYPDAAYRANLGSEAMYQAIRDRGYNVVFLFGTRCRDAYEARPFAYQVGQAYRPYGILTHLDFIQTLIVPTAMEGLPPRARVVLAVHDIFDSPVERGTVPALLPFPGGTARVVTAATPKADSYDYLLVPSAAAMAGQRAQPMTRHTRVAVPLGYLKLDANIARLAREEGPVDSLVYATTVMKNEFGPFVSLPDHGEAILAALLENFPSHRIIFRPHPHTRHFKCVKDIADRFGADPRFTLDDDPTDYLRTYARSAAMVTDMSGTAFTYAFSTLRPVVFFSHNEQADIETVFREVSYFRHRRDIGTVATTPEEMVEQLRAALAEGNARDRIERFRASMMFHLGGVENYLVENIHVLMSGGLAPGWVVLPSAKYCGGLEDPLHQRDAPMLVEEGFKGFNLVYYRNEILALAIRLGPVHVQELEPADRERLKRQKTCFIAGSVPEVKAQILASRASG